MTFPGQVVPLMTLFYTPSLLYSTPHIPSFFHPSPLTLPTLIPPTSQVPSLLSCPMEPPTIGCLPQGQEERRREANRPGQMPRPGQARPGQSSIDRGRVQPNRAATSLGWAGRRFGRALKKSGRWGGPKTWTGRARDSERAERGLGIGRSKVVGM